MTQYFQKALGMFNKQSMTIVEQRKVIDFVPAEIEEILNEISKNQSVDNLQGELTPPNLVKKNKLNSIEEPYWGLIEGDFIHFERIDLIFKNDKVLQGKYEVAKRILQQQYLSNFKSDFPTFANAWMSKIGSEKTAIESIKTVILLHYMYSECDIGVSPK